MTRKLKNQTVLTFHVHMYLETRTVSLGDKTYCRQPSNAAPAHVQDREHFGHNLWIMHPRLVVHA